jgi:hypothetical protein
MLQVYELAYLLHMPVYQLVEMPYDEFTGWFEYFEKRPVGWREDDRTMKLLQVQGMKAAPSSVFASLAKMQEANAKAKEDGRISIDNLKRSALFNKMLSATGGEKLEL